MRVSSSTTLIEKIQEGLFVVLFFVPLVFITNANELYEFPKTFLVYLLGACIVFLFVIDIIWNQKKLVRPNYYVLLFLAANIVATIFSSYKYTALFGYYGRFNGGLISTLTFFLIYVVAINIKGRISLERIAIICSSLTLLPIGIYAIQQHFSGVTRVYSTIGQPNWLAAYVGMILPVVIYQWIKSTNNLYRSALFVLYMLGYCALWFSYSLSGIAGFLVGLGVLVAQQKKELKGNLKQYLLLGAISLIISVARPGIFKDKITDALRDTSGVISQSIRVYAQEASHNLSDPGFIRTNLWKGTIKLAFSHPKIFLVGTGPETFPYEFPLFRNNELNYSSEWSYVLNKPHNYYLELLATSGIFGLVSYLLLSVSIFRKRHPWILPSMAVFYVTNFFGWPTASTALLFWLWLALLEKD